MEIYLDVCCLNRPFDDQSQERIRLESEAVRLVIEKCERGVHRLMTSEVVEAEIAQNPDADRRAKVQELLRAASRRLTVVDTTREVAASFVAAGIRSMDALHLAVADEAGCELLLTTDDEFIRRAKRVSTMIRVRVENPARWMMEQATQ